MSHLDETNLLIVLESLSERGSWGAAAGAIGSCEQTLFNYVNRSRKAQAAGEKETSPFFLEWRDTFDWWHSHCKRARAENINSIEGLVRQQTKEGVIETCFDPSTGYPLQARDPQYIGVSDDEMRENFLHPVRDRLLWTDPDAAGVRHPIYQTKTTTLAASLRQKVISGILPRIYGDKMEHSHKVVGSVNHTFGPAAYVPRAQRLAASNVVDADFKELPAPEAERPDIAALRAEWAKREAEVAKGQRHTAPDDPTKVQVFTAAEPFRPNSEDGGERTVRESARELPPDQQRHTQYAQAPEPPQTPSYARKTDPRFAGTRDPHNPANRATKAR